MKSCSKLYLDYFIFMFIFILLFYNLWILLEKSCSKKKKFRKKLRSIKIESKLTKIQKLCQILWKISICKTVMEATAWTLWFLLTNLKGLKNISKNLHENKIVHWDLKCINIVDGHELFWWEQNYCRKKILLILILILQKKDTADFKRDTKKN